MMMRYVQGFLLLSMTLMSLCAPKLQGVSNDRWPSVGPIDPTIGLLVGDPNHPEIIYTVSEQGVYRSLDQAHSWQRITEGPRWTILVHPRTSEVLLMNPVSLLASTDHGNTFQPLAKPKVYVDRLLWDPQDPNVLYALADYNLLASYNHARTWHSLPQPPHRLPEHYRCQVTGFFFGDGLVLAPKTIYLSGSADAWCGYSHDETLVPHFWVSRDGGNRWKFLENQSYRFARDLAVPGEGFAFDELEQGRIYKVSNRIGTRELRGRVPWLAEIRSVPGDPSLLYARSYSGKVRLWQSSDAGQSFQPGSHGFPYPISSVQPLPDGGLVVGTQGAGIFQWNAGGSGWVQHNRGLSGGSSYLLARSGERLFATSYINTPMFLYSRSIHERLWKLELLPFRIFGLAANPADGNNLVAVSDDGFHVTRDAGRSWKLAGPYKYPASVTFDNLTRGRVYGSYNFSCIARSSDGGVHWNKLFCLDSDAVTRIRIDPFDSRVIFFVSRSGQVFRSDDEGKTARLTDAPPAADIAPLPGRKNGWVLAGESGLFLTLNGGKHWTRQGNAPAGSSARLVSVDRAGKHLYLMDDETFWESTDGTTWKNITSNVAGSPRTEFFDMIDVPSGVYVAGGSGVFASPD